MLKAAKNRSIASPRWDIHDSSKLIQLARKVYFHYITKTYKDIFPKGVVINQALGTGRVVFNIPSLLPGEEYLGLSLFISDKRNLKSKSRSKS